MKTFDFENVPGLSKSNKLNVHDMWTGTDVFVAGETNYSVSVLAHDTAAFLITAV